MYEESHLRYIKFPEDFIIKQVTGCDNRKPQMVNRGIGQWISFSCTFYSLPSSLLFHSYCTPMGIFHLFVFFTFLSNYHFPRSSCLGICLLAWHLSFLVQDEFNVHIKILLALFFLLLCSRFLIHPSPLDQIFHSSSLSFI